MEKGAFCCTVQRECKLVHILGKGNSNTIKNKNIHTPYSEIPLLRITASAIHDSGHIHKESRIRMFTPTHFLKIRVLIRIK